MRSCRKISVAPVTPRALAAAESVDEREDADDEDEDGGAAGGKTVATREQHLEIHGWGGYINKPAMWSLALGPAVKVPH